MQGFTCMTSCQPMPSCPNPSTACVFPPFLGTLPSSRSCAFLRGQPCLLQACQPTLQSDVPLKPSFLPIGANPRVPEPSTSKPDFWSLACPHPDVPEHSPSCPLFARKPQTSHDFVPDTTGLPSPPSESVPWCGVQRRGWLIHSLVVNPSECRALGQA